jgi:hypothetical protein
MFVYRFGHLRIGVPHCNASYRDTGRLATETIENVALKETAATPSSVTVKCAGAQAWPEEGAQY